MSEAQIAIVEARMRFDPETSTNENLRRRGLATRPAAGPRPGCKDVVDTDGRVLVTGNCAEVNEWLRAQDATHTGEDER